MTQPMIGGSIVVEAVKDEIDLPDPKPKGFCRWRRLVEVYIEDWKYVWLRDPESIGWAERSLLGKIIDGVFGGQSPEQREAERQEHYRVIETGLEKLTKMGDKHLAVAFRVFHLHPKISIAEQCRRLKVRERKYHQYRQEAVEYLRWYIYEIKSQGGDDEGEQDISTGKSERAIDVAGAGYVADRAWAGAIA